MMLVLNSIGIEIIVLMSVEISSRSLELINKYGALCDAGHCERPSITTPIDLASQLFWFNEELIKPAISSVKEQQELELILMLLRTELLHDLYLSMTGEDINSKESIAGSSYADKIKFVLLFCAGILVAGCEGFDCMVTMMSIFSLSSTIIFACGVIFSICAIIAFCGFKLANLSSSLGVRLVDAHQLLDTHLRQLDTVKLIRRKIADYNLNELSRSELKELEQIIIMLQQRLVHLAATSKQFDEVLNSKSMQWAHMALSGVIGALLFGGSFCAGQTVSLYVLSMLMIAATPASLPVILFSLLVGSAAISLYWCFDFPGLKTLVSSWLGLSEEKINTLCDENLLAEAKKLNKLKEKVISAMHLKGQLPQWGSKDSVNDERIEDESVLTSKSHGAGTNIYSFMPSPRSSKPLDDEPQLSMVDNCL